MTHLVETWGVLAVFVLSVAQSLGVPTSSELTFGLVGLLWALGRMNPIAGVAAGVLGETLGAIVAWRLATAAIGSSWWHRFEQHPVVRAFHTLLQQLLQRRGGVVVSRLIPLERNVAAWVGGIAEVPFLGFALQSALGTLIFATAFVVAGYEAKDAIASIAHRVGQAGEVLAVLLVIVVALGLRHLLHENVRRRSSAARVGEPREVHEELAAPITLESAAYLGALGRIHRSAAEGDVARG